MDVKARIKEIEEKCNKYGFWERKIMPYGFGIKVKRIFRNWKDYDLCTETDKSIIRSEIRGFLPILAHWVEYEEEPMVKILMTKGEYEGAVKEYHKSTADIFIESGMAVAI